MHDYNNDILIIIIILITTIITCVDRNIIDIVLVYTMLQYNLYIHYII